MKNKRKQKVVCFCKNYWSDTQLPLVVRSTRNYHFFTSPPPPQKKRKIETKIVWLVWLRGQPIRWVFAQQVLNTLRFGHRLEVSRHMRVRQDVRENATRSRSKIYFSINKSLNMDISYMKNKIILPITRFYTDVIQIVP